MSRDRSIVVQSPCLPPTARFTEPPPLSQDATPAQRMAHKLKTLAGREIYALRKQTVEPVFGIIKSVLGFRQFSLRGLKNVSGEWQLVCLAWNLKRMATLCLQPGNREGKSTKPPKTA